MNTPLCKHCNTPIIQHGCPQCGAPNCCPKCCDETTKEINQPTLTERINYPFKFIVPQSLALNLIGTNDLIHVGD